MELRKEWFEPGNSENNLSPFEREYHLAHANDIPESISAAFRALLAEEERLEEIVKDTNNVLDVMTRDLAAERDALQSKCNELEMEKSLGWHEYDELKIRYDALQACFDAGVRVYSLDCKDWHTERCLSDNHSATLIIDQPDAAMVDERTGKADRRTGWPPLYVRQFSRDGLPDRRRTTGTIADRDKP